MHVLQLGPYPPPEGGITRNLLAIREELRRRGHRCSVAAIAKSTAVTPEEDVHHPQSPLRLIRLLVKLDYDLLHVHAGGDVNLRFFGLLLACRVFGKGPKVLSFHSGGFTDKHKDKARKLSLPGLIFRSFRKTICVNPAMLRMFRDFGVEEETLHLILPYRLDRPDAAVEIPRPLSDFIENHRPLLLTSGLLEKEYDLFLQIDAFERVLSKYQNAGLMIVGSGSLESELRRHIESKTYAERILLAGDVRHAVALRLIDSADLLIRTTRFDGDAIAVREAIFLGVPVIATDNGLRPYGVDLIPAPASEETLVSKIFEILENGGAVEKLGSVSDGRENIEAVVLVYEEALKI